ARYDVSRATVREALRLLAERGLIEKRHGIGSVVSARRIVEKLPGITGFSTEMRLLGHGYVVRSEVLGKNLQPASVRIANLLDLPPDSSVLRVTRLRYVDEQPFLISTSYLPPFVSIDDDFTGSIYKLFETRYSITVSAGEASIEAGLATPEEARLLSIQPHASVLRITWIGESEDGRPVEYSEGTYRGDHYRYVVQMRR
ncbi:MAG: GntR family transcriptional regulator, partial [Anaerolineae bacterium]|nr:GntR family transcriptional regulator [Anaerolineae bacterium]